MSPQGTSLVCDDVRVHVGVNARTVCVVHAVPLTPIRLKGWLTNRGVIGCWARSPDWQMRHQIGAP